MFWSLSSNPTNAKTVQKYGKVLLFFFSIHCQTNSCGHIYKHPILRVVGNHISPLIRFYIPDFKSTCTKQNRCKQPSNKHIVFLMYIW